MNNKDNYKKAMDNIHASDELKNKTFQKIKSKPKNNLVFIRLLSACAVFAIVFGVGAFYHSNPNIKQLANNKTQTADEQLPRFKDIEELKEVLAKSKNNNRLYKDSDLLIESLDMAATETAIDSSVKGQTNSEESEDYSTTNVQVADVDEADIVKTDGEYIYYVKNNMVYIVEASNLKIVSKLDFDEDENDFIPNEIFVNKDKLIVLGTSYIFDEEEDDDDDFNYSYYYGYNYRNQNTVTEAVVMDISDMNKPKELRRVGLDGSYNNSRMIGDNLYFISNKPVYYYDDIEDHRLLPYYLDSTKGKETYTINAEDIAYFGGTRRYSYMLVAGFNINNKENANIETIYGASDTVYASTENLYIVQDKYTSSGNRKSIIYKFNFEDSKIVLKAKGQIKGYLNDQFSMDEYEGNLRVATTSYIAGITKNQVYVLDENLEIIGSIKNMAINEEIYSVRFLGKIGYVVTFEEIDPLFVIDLSDPTNPQIKGELKIPGYSSYLHPYDDTHIIGIGYNTEDNGFGGVVNKNMKMSMFDVSNLEDPKEIFSIDIGDEYAYSEITYNHKALFYNKSKNLIGFPVTYRTNNYNKSKSGFAIYKIDLNKGFELYGDLTEKTNYSNSPERVIYIKDVLYTIFQNNIDSYDLNTLDKKDSLDLK